MAKKADPNEGHVKHIDPETGEVTYGPPTDADQIKDAEIVPEGETVEATEQQFYEGLPAAAEGDGGPELESAAEAPVDPDFADLDPPERIHAYDAGEFTPELTKMMGDMRNFILGRIRNNWKPWQQMTVQDQQDLVNAVEQQARDMIRGTVRALNDYEYPHCSVTLGQVTIKGIEKGIEAKITCQLDPESLAFLGQHVEKRVLIVVTNAEDFFGARDWVKLDGKNSQMDLPLGGSVKDIEAGGFAAEAEALRAPVLDGPEPDALAPEPGEEVEPPAAPDEGEGEEPPPGFTWPDDEHLGQRDDDTLPGEA